MKIVIIFGREKEIARVVLYPAIKMDGKENNISGYATTIDSPLPPGSLGYHSVVDKKLTESERILKAQSLLQKGGWKFDEKKLLEKIIPYLKKSSFKNPSYALAKGNTK